MKTRILLALAASLFVTGAYADDGTALMKKFNCGTCHHATNKTVGPSIKAIAEKYHGDAGAAARLEAKVRKGGSGSFGTMGMPPTPAAASDADIKAMVASMLASH